MKGRSMIAKEEPGTFLPRAIVNLRESLKPKTRGGLPRKAMPKRI